MHLHILIDLNYYTVMRMFALAILAKELSLLYGNQEETHTIKGWEAYTGTTESARNRI